MEKSISELIEERRVKIRNLEIKNYSIAGENVISKAIIKESNNAYEIVKQENNITINEMRINNNLMLIQVLKSSIITFKLLK